MSARVIVGLLLLFILAAGVSTLLGSNAARGGEVASGVKVEARINNIQYAQSVTDPNTGAATQNTTTHSLNALDFNYGSDANFQVCADDPGTDGIVEGGADLDTITFFVDSRQATALVNGSATTITFLSGASDEVDLKYDPSVSTVSATSPADACTTKAPPTPTPTPVTPVAADGVPPAEVVVGVVPSPTPIPTAIPATTQAVEDAPLEQATETVEQATTAQAVEIFEGLTTTKAAQITEGLTTTKAVAILEQLSTAKAAEILEQVSTAKVVEILEQLSTTKAAQILEQVSTAKVVEILELLSTAKAAQIQVSPLKAAAVMEVLPTPKLIEIVQFMTEAKLIERLPELTLDKLFEIPVAVLLAKLPNVPVDMITIETPPQTVGDLPSVVTSTLKLVVYQLEDHPGQVWGILSASPAPIDGILAKFAGPVSNVQTSIEDLAEKPAELPDLPSAQIVNSFLRIDVENVTAEDIEAVHVTLFVEKAWIASNQVHKWSIQFSRFDEELGLWVPFPAKRVREDTERVDYTVVVPGFSVIAITGSRELPAQIFRVTDLQIAPAAPEGGEEFTVSARVANTGSTQAVYPARLWIDNTIEATQAIVVEPNQTAPFQFTVTKPDGGLTASAWRGCWPTWWWACRPRPRPSL